MNCFIKPPCGFNYNGLINGDLDLFLWEDTLQLQRLNGRLLIDISILPPQGNVLKFGTLIALYNYSLPLYIIYRKSLMYAKKSFYYYFYHIVY